MNTHLYNIEGVIYYDNQKELYNFPYTLEFSNEKVTIDYIFHRDNFKNQKEMLVDRNLEVSRNILNNYFFKQFERIQEICLEENQNSSEELLVEINQRLDIMFYLFIIIVKLNKEYTITSQGNNNQGNSNQGNSNHVNNQVDNEIIDTLWSLYDELLEMFVLLEDFYAGVRKFEILERKKKFLNLENKNEN